VLADCPENAGKLKRGLIVPQQASDLMLSMGLRLCCCVVGKLSSNFPLLSTVFEVVYSIAEICVFTI
jgi:tellurite resistance protein TehA-like permease